MIPRVFFGCVLFEGIAEFCWPDDFDVLGPFADFRFGVGVDVDGQEKTGERRPETGKSKYHQLKTAQGPFRAEQYDLFAGQFPELITE